MIDTESIRIKVLELAMRGGLSEQRIEDRKSVPEHILPTELTKEERPYKIPKNWVWVKVKDIILKDVGGGTPSKSVPEYWNGGTIPWVTVKDFSGAESGYLKDTIDHITQEGLDNSASNMVDEDAIIICMRMALGKIVRVARPMAINQDLRAIWLKEYVLEDYFVYFYSTLKVEGRGMTVSGIRKDELMNYAFPVPPIREQERIVKKIDEIFKQLNVIEKLQNLYLTNLNLLKNKLIDAAIQGKLTQQLPEDGTAEDLYVEIQVEKAKILEQRNSREDKKIKDVEDDVPFDVPSHWKWIRLGDIGLFKKGPFGSALTKSMFVQKGTDTIKVYEQQHAIKKDCELGTYYITREYFNEKMSGFEVMSGDIIVSCAGTIGETYIMPDNIEQGIINQALMRVTLAEGIDKKFFQYYFDINLKKTAQEESNGSAIKNIPPFDVLKNWYFPLTSLEEQRRIVSKIDEIITYM